MQDGLSFHISVQQRLIIMFLVMVYCYLAITLLMTPIKIKHPRDLRETSILKF